MNVDPATLDAQAVAVYARTSQGAGIVAFPMDVIPGSVTGAFASGNILQVLLFAVLFGFALQLFGQKEGQPIFNVIGEFFVQVIFGIINMIMRPHRLAHSARWPSPSYKYGVGSWCNWGSLHYLLLYHLHSLRGGGAGDDCIG